MKVALIGASGMVGKAVLDELVRRGIAVTAIARRPERIASGPLVTPAGADLFDGEGLAAALRGHDAVVSAVRFRDSDPALLIAAVKLAGVERYIAVGGAGTLEVEPGITLYERGWKDLPDNVRIEGSGARVSLDALRRERELDWACVTPPSLFTEGERTGTFRTSGDAMLLPSEGKSTISYADFAIAVADELERPMHHRQRLSVAY